MTKQTVTLQGKTYDAVTGAVIQDVAPTSQKPAAKPVAVQQPPQHPTARNSNHTKHHTTQSAQTLMRHAVKKPTASIRSQTKTQSALAHQHPQQITVKRSAIRLDSQRLERAQAVPRHAKIGRFNVPSAISFVLADIPVKQMPDGRPTNTPPETPPPTPTNKPQDMFERAIESATHFVDLKTHRREFKKRAKRHVLIMATGTMAALTITGLALYQNSPSIQLQVASYRAGVATVTPDFDASGFTYNGASVQGARVIIGLTADGTRYQLSQQETNWSSEEMIAQVSSIDASGQTNYETLSVDDITVYKFGGVQATWVAHGIWYQLSGDRSLSDAQISALIRNT